MTTPAPKGVPEVDYRGIFNAGPVLYLILLPDNPRFTIVGASDIYLETTRRRREDIVGKGVFEAFPPNPDDVSGNMENAFRAAFARVMETRKFDVMPVQQYDIPIPESEGGGFEVRFWSPTHTPILDAQGDVVQIAQRVEDVTELIRLKNQGQEQTKMNEELKRRSGQMEAEVLLRAKEIKEANNKLLQANERLKELDRLKTEFFANISHEFRTPLTLILGPLSDLLSSWGSPDDPARAMLETTHRNALRLLKLVNNLLDFSKLEAGRARVLFEPTDLAVLTADLASTFRSAIETAGLKLIVDCEKTSDPVFIDRESWEKIVLNLLSNAFKYTLRGEIQVSLAREPGFAALSVSDTGVGIPDGEIGKVFQRFHRVKGVEGRTHEGTGIGLALVEELVKLHGGAAEVRSAFGRGTTFKIRIPLGAAHLAPECVSKAARTLDLDKRRAEAFLEEAVRWSPSSAMPEADSSSDSEAPARKMRVVVADDNADMRDYVARLLGRAYEIIPRSNGKEALEAIRQGNCDLLVSDIMMPVMDGIELLKAVRSDPAAQKLPVILLTARAGREALVAEGSLGADDCLTKPFSAAELISRVRTQIGLSQMRSRIVRELESTNKELEAFSYSISHDLRAPLRGMIGFGEIVLEEHGSALDQKGRERLQRIVLAGKRMELLIEGLLSLAKLSREEVRFESVDLSRIAQALSDQITAAEPGRKAEIVVRPGMKAVGDPRLLELVLQNLMNNAWKFTSRKEVARIEAGDKEENGEKIYYVKDNGAGFDMKHAAKLFGSFQRLHTEAEFPGTGIGLATVQRIIQRHGGRIWATAAVGQGATFHFTLSTPRLRSAEGFSF